MDVNVEYEEIEKVEKYQELKREIKRLWKLKKVEVVPVVIGALGCVAKGLEKGIESLRFTATWECFKRLRCWELPGFAESTGVLKETP